MWTSTKPGVTTSPVASSELRTTGVIAVVSSIIAIVIYVWFRFEWQFALGTVVALAHDVLVTAGISRYFQLQFDLSIVAALLTILGYSVNDTVVVSDRIRENMRKYKKMELDELLTISINETLSRTILTGLTAIAGILALYFFGGEVLRNFSFAMLFGILIGTYSSVFIAAPLLGYLGVKRDWSGAAAAQPKTAAGKVDIAGTFGGTKEPLVTASSAHYPHPAPIDAYGNGGFRFAGMSHKGSIMCLPSGIHAWDVSRIDTLGPEHLVRALAGPGDRVGLLLLGTGARADGCPRPSVA